MANNNIGGFFVSLGMKVDNSFKQGEAAITKFIGTSTKAAAAAVGIAKVAGVVENTNLKLAKAIGISGEELKAWQDSATKAGVSAGALTSSMAQIENKMQKLKLGQVDEGLAKSLGMLGIGYDQFAGMGATERMRSVFGAAGAMADQAKAAALVGDTLGSAAREYYDWLALSGRTLDQELDASRALNFITEGTMKSASQFNAEFNGLLNTTKSIAMLIGSKIGEELTPIMRTLQKILYMNKDLITSGIIGIVENFKKIREAFAEVFKGFDIGFDFSSLDKLGNKFKELTASLTKLMEHLTGEKGLERSIGKVMGSIATSVTNMAGGVLTSLSSILQLIDVFTNKDMSIKDKLTKAGTMAWAMFGSSNVLASKQLKDQSLTDVLSTSIMGASWTWDELNRDAKLELQSAIKNGASINNFSRFVDVSTIPSDIATRKIKDGIIAPGGQVTQVAPDDWVFAARNLGDMAAAFMPRGMAQATTNNSNASYTINQSFNFQGGRDMAAEVMRQAYSGTQSGLLAAMNKSTQRIQLMPGLR